MPYRSQKSPVAAPSNGVRPALKALAMGVGLGVGAPALAAFPDDVSLSSLSTWNGEEVTRPGTLQGAYETVVKELGASIANKRLAPAETLGVAGFDMAITNTASFIRVRDSPQGAGTLQDPSPWQRVHEDGDPTGVLWNPGVTVRKGLPLSLEAGVNAGYVAFSKQTTLGAFGRWGILEGYREAPDLSIQVGYASYLGNPELQVGVMDMSASLGYTVPFGTLNGINNATFSPYVGAGLLRINGSPNLSAAEQAALNIGQVSGFKGDREAADAGFSPVDIHGGFRLQTGDVQILMSANYTVGIIPSVSTGFGYVF